MVEQVNVGPLFDKQRDIVAYSIHVKSHFLPIFN